MIRKALGMLALTAFIMAGCGGDAAPKAKPKDTKGATPAPTGGGDKAKDAGKEAPKDAGKKDK